MLIIYPCETTATVPLLVWGGYPRSTGSPRPSSPPLADTSKAGPWRPVQPGGKQGGGTPAWAAGISVRRARGREGLRGSPHAPPVEAEAPPRPETDNKGREEHLPEDGPGIERAGRRDAQAGGPASNGSHRGGGGGRGRTSSDTGTHPTLQQASPGAEKGARTWRIPP